MTAHEQLKTLFVVGAGPGIGLAVARRFAREGFRVGLVARNATRLETLADTLRDEGTKVETSAADASDPGELRTALEGLAAAMGSPDVVCFSPLPSIGLIKPVLDTTADDLATSLALNVGGAAATVGAVVPGMLDRGAGTLLFTTGSGALRPSSDRAASAVTTAAESMYVRLLHDALAPRGIHVSQAVIVGAVGPGERHEPATIAEVLWTQHVHRDRALTVIE